jgi:hypothetical protein
MALQPARDSSWSQPAASQVPAAAVPAEAAPLGDLLDAVVQRTVAMLNCDDPADPGAMDAALAVARRHAGEALSPRPIVAELVRAMLDRQFERCGEGARSLWQSLSGLIAETLWDDPAARERLERLWEKLMGKLDRG